MQIRSVTDMWNKIGL